MYFFSFYFLFEIIKCILHVKLHHGLQHLKKYMLRYGRIRILLTCGKHPQDHITSLGGDIWVHKTSLSPSLFIAVPVTSQENMRSCICVLGVFILPLSIILIFDFGDVPTVWHCFSIVLPIYCAPQYITSANCLLGFQPIAH